MCGSATCIAAHPVTSPGDSAWLHLRWPDVRVITNPGTRRFGRVNELYNMSFEVAVGAITGLFGPDGAGKTTLMSTIGAHDRAATKSVRLLGENPFEYARAMASTNLWLPSSPPRSSRGGWSTARSR